MVDAGFLSIIPPIVAIVLALVTKEVIFSLLLGVFSGTIIYSALAGLGPFGVLSTTVEIMIDKFGANADMILFLCFLGILVILITKAGGARAYGEWASSKLKTDEAFCSQQHYLVSSSLLMIISTAWQLEQS